MNWKNVPVVNATACHLVTVTHLQMKFYVESTVPDMGRRSGRREGQADPTKLSVERTSTFILDQMALFSIKDSTSRILSAPTPVRYQYFSFSKS